MDHNPKERLSRYLLEYIKEENPRGLLPSIDMIRDGIEVFEAGAYEAGTYDGGTYAYDGGTYTVTLLRGTQITHNVDDGISCEVQSTS